jgi:hypothetical protein
MPKKKTGKASGVNITISEQTADKIAKAGLDIISPISESLGALGDRIRVFREVTLRKTLKRAKQLAEQEDLQIEAPPPKFLLPYLEAASLEDEEDEKLHEMWARLLVTAGKTPDSYAYVARNFLAEISSNEAQVLDWVVKETGVAEFTEFVRYRERNNHRLSLLCQTISAQLQAQISQSRKETEILSEALAEVGELLVLTFHLKGKTGVFTRDDFDKQYHHFQILEGHRLMDELTYQPENWLKGPVLSLSYLRITQLGFGVIKKLYPKPATEKNNE